MVTKVGTGSNARRDRGGAKFGSFPPGNWIIKMHAKELNRPRPGFWFELDIQRTDIHNLAIMSFASMVGSGARLAAKTPALWAYGVVSAGLGAAIMVSGLLAAFPQYDEPVGHGLLGWLVLGAVMAVSLAVEAAACRAAVRGGGLADAAIDAGRLLPRSAALVPALLALAILFCLFIAVPLLAFMRTFLAAILMMIFPFAVNVTIIVGSLIAALALLVPAWMLVPLAVRGVGVHDRSVAESLADAMTVIEERTGAAALFGLVCIGLDAALLIGGARLGARDLSLTGHFHVLTTWSGTRLAAGGFVLAAVALVATFKAGVWTALYLDVAGEENWRDSSREAGAAAAEPRGDLRRVALLARTAAQNVCRSLVPFILAALIVFVGAPAAADLLTVYGLVPRSADDSVYRITHQIPGGGTTLLMLVLPAWLMSLLFSTSLLAATEPLARQQPTRLTTALQIGVYKLFMVIAALVLMAVVAVIIGGTVLVGVLLAMALIVQFAKGLNQLADQFGDLIAIGVIAVPVILAPIVSRAVVFEKLPPNKALGRAFEIATSRPWATLLVFLITISLEVLRGPIAKWAGLIPSGWIEIYALSGSLHPPIARAKLTYSAAAMVVATLFLAFEAQLWTEFYRSQPTSNPAPPRRRARKARRLATADEPRHGRGR
jgi:hypothetical protein